MRDNWSVLKTMLTYKSENTQGMVGIPTKFFTDFKSRVDLSIRGWI